MSDAFTRERAYQERLREGYEARRTVLPRLTEKQADALLAFYEHRRATDPLPTVLHAAFREVAHAIEAGGDDG
jgi:hypothetical protein